MRGERRPVLTVLCAVLGADGNTKHNRHFQNAGAHRLPFCNLIEDFIARAADEVGIHQLDNRASAAHRVADGRADDGRLGNRCVEEAVVGNGFGHLLVDAERAAPVAVVLAVNNERGILVEFIDDVFTGHLKLLSQYGYSNSVIWQLLEDGASKSDLTFLLENKLENEVTEPFRQVKGYTIKNMLNYIAKYNEVKDYNYAVNIVNYPFIISSNGKPGNYEIKNPDELLTLVKQGFYLSADYEPDDLVEPEEEYVAPDCGNRMLRKDAYEAMVKMIKAAEKEDLHLLLNSGYRSYAEQTKIYNETEAKYGGAYAAEYVAKPGASEHQTGLGLDMTSQSVVDGKRLVFSDTAEYKWVLANCQKYGFVIRFEEGTDNITGISHEPWHLRYVGEDVARDMTEHGWTFEEYCLYNSVIPELKKE